MATLYGGSLRLHTPLIFTIGFLCLFTFGGLTGVILSNASLDIAFHDTSDSYNVVDTYSFIATYTLLPGLLKPVKLTGDRLAAFVVGLIDGDGSFQVNHWRGKSLQYRLVVKLKYNDYNKAMLEHIASVYGGQVNTVTVSKTGYQFVQ